MSALLEGQALSKSFAGRAVLDEVSLTVERGEVVGLLGPNGAGKSTLLRLLLGLLDADGGRVLLDGQEITALPTHLRARAGMGFLPQEASAFANLTVADNLEVVRRLAGRPESAAPLLRTFGLDERRGQRASTLSGGERRRLELARLLCTGPKVVLLDEPFKGLDPVGAASLSKTLQTRRAGGVGILLCDHNVEQALALCQRVYVLVDGRIAACGSAAEVASHPEARRVFFATVPGHHGDAVPARADPDRAAAREPTIAPPDPASLPRREERERPQTPGE
jgi:lipopolysaccharide export system ATP-binding protein